MKWRKTKRGVIITRWFSQVEASEKRGHVPPDYSYEELIEWATAQDKFHEVYAVWAASDFHQELAPSFDRVDGLKSYTLDNLQILHFFQNREKYSMKVVAGKRKGTSKPVIATCRKTGVETRFRSAFEASRRTGAPRTNITNCCSGKRDATRDHTWRYAV